MHLEKQKSHPSLKLLMKFPLKLKIFAVEAFEAFGRGNGRRK
jgi:hypothetical protein